MAGGDTRKDIAMSRDQSAGRGQSMKIDNSSFEKVEEFKHLGKILTNQNSIQEVIMRELKPRIACYHLVQNLLSFSLLYSDIKIKAYRTRILHVVLYGCETRSLTLKEEHSLRVFKNRVLKKIFRSKRDEVTGREETKHW